MGGRPLRGRIRKITSIDKTSAFQTFEDALGQLIASHFEIDGSDKIISAMELQIMAMKEEARNVHA